MTDTPDNEALVREAVHTADNAQGLTLSARDLVRRLAAALQAASRAPQSVPEATSEDVWRVCAVIREECVCDHCPATEDHGDGYGLCTRACYLQALECVNVVQTGNPWRKTVGVKAPWTVKTTPPTLDAGEGTRETIERAAFVCEQYARRLGARVDAAPGQSVTIGVGLAVEIIAALNRTHLELTGRPSAALAAREA